LSNNKKKYYSTRIKKIREPNRAFWVGWSDRSKQGLRFRREAFSRLSPGTGNRPVPGENRQKPNEMALQIQKSGNRFFRPGTGVF